MIIYERTSYIYEIINIHSNFLNKILNFLNKFIFILIKMVKVRRIPLLITSLFVLFEYITSVLKVRSPKELASKFISKHLK
jgi:hypothetical protein